VSRAASPLKAKVAGSRLSARRICAGLVAAALVGTTAWAVTSAQQQATSSHAQPMSPTADQARSPEPTVIRRLEPWQQARFGLFRTAPERLPEEIRHTLATPAHGTNWLLSQRLRIVSSSETWAVPGKGFVCLVDRDAKGGLGQVCASRREALRHGVTITSLLSVSPSARPSERSIVGIVPDHTRAVVIHTGKEAVRTQAYQNVFAVRDDLAIPPDRITLR
jgi:hypothetical protein